MNGKGSVDLAELPFRELPSLSLYYYQIYLQSKMESQIQLADKSKKELWCIKQKNNIERMKCKMMIIMIDLNSFFYKFTMIIIMN